MTGKSTLLKLYPTEGEVRIDGIPVREEYQWEIRERVAVVFGQFVDTGSFIHRMDPRIKLAAVFTLLVASFLLDSFSGFAVAFLLLILIQLVSRIPLAYVLRGSAYYLGFLLFILIFQVLFY